MIDDIEYYDFDSDAIFNDDAIADGGSELDELIAEIEAATEGGDNR